MLVKDVMMPAPGHVSGRTSLRDASATMKSLKLDPIPVVDDGRVVGMLSDEDVRATVAESGISGGMRHAEDVMRTKIVYLAAGQDVAEAVDVLEAHGVTEPGWRVPVVDSERRLVGIVSVHDLRERDTEGGDETNGLSGVRPADQVLDFDQEPVEYMSDGSFPASDPVPPPSTLGPDRRD